MRFVIVSLALIGAVSCGGEATLVEVPTHSGILVTTSRNCPIVKERVICVEKDGDRLSRIDCLALPPELLEDE